MPLMKTKPLNNNLKQALSGFQNLFLVKNILRGVYV